MKKSGIFKNVLVTYVRPTDKETAFKTGLSLAKDNDAKLSVVEFIPEESSSFLFFKTKKDVEKVKAQKQFVLEMFEKFEQQAKKENIPLSTSYKTTEALVDTILNYVQSNKIDLLIVDHPQMSHSEEVHYNDIVSAIHDEVNCNMLTLK